MAKEIFQVLFPTHKRKIPTNSSEWCAKCEVFWPKRKKEGTSRVPLLRTLCYVSLRRASVYTNHLKDWFPVRTNVTYRASFLRQKTPNFGAYLRFFDDVFSLHLVCSSVSFGAHLLKIVTFFHFTWCVWLNFGFFHGTSNIRINKPKSEPPKNSKIGYKLYKLISFISLISFICCACAHANALRLAVPMLPIIYIIS